MSSVRELLLDFIEKLIERNVPHYFIIANNILDDLLSNVDIDNEIRLLLWYSEEGILEIVRKESMASKMNPCFLFLTNENLFSIATTLSGLSMSTISYRNLKKYTMSCNCGNYNSNFYPELEYLHRGIAMHLQLSKLKKNENLRSRQDLITSAEELFDLSIHKLDYGFTRIRLHLGWSVFEFCQQLRLLCRNKHCQVQNPIMHAESSAQRAISTSCYIRDRDEYIRNLCPFSQNSAETRAIPILQEMVLSESPVNPTYVVCSVFRVNFLYSAVCDYRRAMNLCEEVNRIWYCPSNQYSCFLLADYFRFSLRNEWCGLYDKYIQIILGFLTLHITLKAPKASRRRMISVHICSDEYLKYIYSRCCIILNEPNTDFVFKYNPFCLYKLDILKYHLSVSRAILGTALYISNPSRLHGLHFCRKSIST